MAENNFPISSSYKISYKNGETVLTKELKTTTINFNSSLNSETEELVCTILNDGVGKVTSSGRSLTYTAPEIVNERTVVQIQVYGKDIISGQGARSAAITLSLILNPTKYSLSFVKGTNTLRAKETSEITLSSTMTDRCEGRDEVLTATLEDDSKGDSVTVKGLKIIYKAPEIVNEDFTTKIHVTAKGTLDGGIKTSEPYTLTMVVKRPILGEWLLQNPEAIGVRRKIELKFNNRPSEATQQKIVARILPKNDERMI